MSFANPLLLLGLLGAAVPIIIHLIHKRRPRELKFAALELLLRSVERVEKRWRLRRILLLLSRVMLLAALALAAAGPLLGDEASLGLADRGPERLALVIDASLSMQANYENRSAFERALLEARNRIDRMGPEDQAVIVAAKVRPELLVERPTANRRQLLDILDRLRPSFGPTELGAAASAGAQALGSLSEATTETEAAPFAARVVVLTDLAPSSLQTIAELAVPGTQRRASLELVDVLADIPAAQRINRAITEIEANAVPGNAPRTMEFRARVQSFEAEKSSAEGVEITLRRAEQELAGASVEVVPGTIVDKVIQFAFESAGPQPVELQLEPDVLLADNRRHVVAEVRPEVRILIVDGAPSGVPKEDEIYYLERALHLGAADQPPPRVITADDLSRNDLSAYDVVVLAGVVSFPATDGARLIDFVQGGGGLFITTSQDMDVTFYNAELGAILPRPLRLMRVVDPATGGLGASGIVTFANPALEHPVLEIFNGDAITGLLSTRSTAYVMLERGQRPLATLIEFDDGQPALVSADAGKGKVALLTTSIDRDLSDLCIRPAFLPLSRRLLLWLGGALAKPDVRRTIVGDTRELRIPNTARAARVVLPDATEIEVELPSPPTGTAVFSRTELPGHYRVEAAFVGDFEPLADETFAVNLDPRESDLRPLSLQDARAVLDGDGERPENSVLSRARALSGDLSPEALVGILLLIMLAAFILESALTAQNIGR